MKKYVCHKVVEAFKIEAILWPLARDGEPQRADGCVIEDDGRRNLCGEENGGDCITVSPQYIQKHNPQIGGYYVRYADGYESFSPAEAFESGYSEEGSQNAEFMADVEKIFREFKMDSEKIDEISKLIST